jgi:Pvc16 N-terminal domain
VATHRAIDAVCQAVVDLLRDAYDPAAFNQDLEFRVYSSANFSQHMTAGVSLFLYRAFINGTHRIPGGRMTAEGKRAQTQLPLDLHFLLTPWGKDASTQNAIAGWMMRTLEDLPILPSGLLNRRIPGVFRADESVEVIIGELATEDLFHLWELIGNNSYRLSVPYLARNVRIESELTVEEHPPIQERVGRFQRFTAGVDVP